MIKVVEDYVLQLYKCRKCGHKWLPRVIKPKQCPNCKNGNWQ